MASKKQFGYFVVGVDPESSQWTGDILRARDIAHAERVAKATRPYAVDVQVMSAVDLLDIVSRLHSSKPADASHQTDMIIEACRTAG